MFDTLNPWCNCPTNSKAQQFWGLWFFAVKRKVLLLDGLYRIVCVCVCAKLAGITRTCTQFSLTFDDRISRFPVHIHSFSILVFTLSSFAAVFFSRFWNFCHNSHSHCMLTLTECNVWCLMRCDRVLHVDVHNRRQFMHILCVHFGIWMLPIFFLCYYFFCNLCACGSLHFCFFHSAAASSSIQCDVIVVLFYIMYIIII